MSTQKSQHILYTAGDLVMVFKEQWELLKETNPRAGIVIRETTDFPKLNRFPYYNIYRSYDILLKPLDGEGSEQIIIAMYPQLTKKGQSDSKEVIEMLKQLPMSCTPEATLFNEINGKILNGKKIKNE
jgi:hypothetical protein